MWGHRGHPAPFLLLQAANRGHHHSPHPLQGHHLSVWNSHNDPNPHGTPGCQTRQLACCLQSGVQVSGMSQHHIPCSLDCHCSKRQMRSPEDRRCPFQWCLRPETIVYMCSPCPGMVTDRKQNIQPWWEWSCHQCRSVQSKMWPRTGWSDWPIRPKGHLPCLQSCHCYQGNTMPSRYLRHECSICISPQVSPPIWW